MNKKVAIIISAYSQTDLLINNIDKIKKNAGYKNYKIYFVDDSGSGKIKEIIRKKFKSVELISNKENLGFSKSYNKGILKSKKEYAPDWFIILNDDCEIKEKNWLKRLIENAEKYPSAGIFGCKIVYPDGSIQWGVKNRKTFFYKEKGTKEKKGEFSKDSESNEVIGAFMFIKKEVIGEVGVFDEKFSPFYGEESDLCFRTLKKGYKINYLGNLSLVHYRDKTISKMPKEKVWYIQKRNSIRLEKKHYPFFKRNYFLVIHFISLLKKEEIPFIKKLRLLVKAYLENRNI